MVVLLLQAQARDGELDADLQDHDHGRPQQGDRAGDGEATREGELAIHGREQGLHGRDLRNFRGGGDAGEAWKKK